MKRKALLILTCLFSLGAWAAVVQTKTYEMNFSPQNFVVKPLKGDTAYIQCNLTDKYKVSYQVGRYNPELPLIDVSLVIPKDCEIEDISYTFTAKSFANGVVLNNGCGAAPIGAINTDKTIEKGWYASKTYAPCVSLLQNTNVGQYRLALFRISPFKYEATKKKLLLCSFKVQVKFKSAPVLEAGKNLLDKLQRKTVKMQVYNPSELDGLYASMKNEVASNNNWKESSNIYYIITQDSLKDAFEPLLQWKRDKGCQAEIITMRQIDTSRVVQPYKIKQYLHANYNRSIVNNVDNIYILLGGDVNIVPTAYVITPNPSSKSSNDSDVWLPCDMYYACIKDASTWYNNNQEILADAVSKSQLNQDGIYVGRCPARTKKQVETFVKKVVSYEKNPPYSSWGNKIFFCGQHVYYYYNNTYSDADYLSHCMADASGINHWTNGVGYLFDTSTNIPAYTSDEELNYGGMEHISTRRVTEQLRSNYSLVHVYTHGTDTTWEIGDGTIPFTKSIADTIQSAYPKIILAESCLTNSFDKDESVTSCLGEAFMRNSNSGVVGYVGNSRQGFVGADYTHPYLKYSDIFSKEFLTALTDSGLMSPTDGHLGKLVLYGKQGLGLNENTNNDPVDRWLNFEINCLGDPEMQLFTSTPQSFPDSSVQGEFKEGSLVVHINTGGIEDYNVTLYQWLDGAKSMSLFEHMPSVWFDNFASDSALVVLHKQNYRPCYLKAYMDVFIQNDTIKTTKSFLGSRIYVGKAVTDKSIHGNVVISQGGSAEILSNKFINLQHGFEVQPKAVLKMNVGSLEN